MEKSSADAIADNIIETEVEEEEERTEPETEKDVLAQYNKYELLTLRGGRVSRDLNPNLTSASGLHNRTL